MGFGALGRCRPAGRALVLLACVSLLGGCGGNPRPPLSGEGDRPPKLEGEATEVDVCSLLPSSLASSVVDHELRIVGEQYGAAQVPTFRCMLGEEFAVPQLTIELAIGPIALDVFEDAYGDRAGGDPQFLKQVGDGAFVRNEKDQRTIHVYAYGSVLSLQLLSDPTQPAERATIVGLARLAVDGLPTNPRLAPTAAGHDCASVDVESVAAAIGAPPTLESGVADADGSLMCSWASRPGSATLTVLRSPSRISAYRQTIDESLYVTVDTLESRPGLTVLSRTDRAGDLLVFSAGGAMAIINVIPSAGHADGATTTTPGEARLAASVIERL
jgi:hypothetical protein